MKRLLAIFLGAVVLTLSGCTFPGMAPKQEQAVFLDLFDTVTTISGYGEDFQQQAQDIHQRLLEYHQLFDIYHEYEGINNLKTINDQAGRSPVAVDENIMALLKMCKSCYDLTDGRVNAAMGSVLSLWHEERVQAEENPEAAALPEEKALKEAGKHCSMDGVILDEEAGTVFLPDPGQRLDVGAIAKGWALEQVAKELPEGLLISVGGSVCATGPKPTGEPWAVGVQSPDGEGYLQILNLSKGCVVTSGDYQRYYTVDGKAYHHIIDPDTAYPGTYWRSVTVVCQDSGLADCLSTALFLLSEKAGQEILDKVQAEAMWVSHDGEISYSPGFEDHIQK